MTLDDAFRAEQFRLAVFVKGGRELLFERLRPYRDSPTFNWSTLSDRKEASQIYTVRADGGEPRLLFPQEADTGYWLGSVSPDGSKVIVFSIREGLLKAGTFDLNARRYQPFGVRPVLQRSSEAVWVGNKTVVLPATLATARTDGENAKYNYAEQLAARQQKSWSGSATSVTVLEVRRGELLSPADNDGILAAVDAADGSARQLDQGVYRSLSVDPSGRYLLAYKLVGNARQRSDQRPEAVGFGHQRHQVVLFDIQEGSNSVANCGGCEPMPNSAAWSADGRAYGFIARESLGSWLRAGFWWGTLNGSLRRLGGEELEAGREQGQSNLPPRGEFIPTSRGAFIYAHPKAPMRPGWLFIDEKGHTNAIEPTGADTAAEVIKSSNDSILILRNGVPWRLRDNGAATAMVGPWQGKLQPVVRSMYSVLGGYSEPSILVSSQNQAGYSVRVLPSGEFNLDSLNVTVAGKAIAVAPAGRASAFASLDGGGLAPTTLSIRWPDGVNRPVLTLNAYLNEVTPATRQLIAFKASDGVQRKACVVLPPNWRPDGRAPMILFVYPGSGGNSACIDGADTYLPYGTLSDELFAGAGYVYVYANASYDLLGSKPGEELRMKEAIDPLMKEVDAEHIANIGRAGVMGESYGGYGALVLLTQTNRFRAAVVGNAATDLVSLYGGTSQPVAAYFQEQKTFGFPVMLENPNTPVSVGAPPWRAPEEYVRKSPLFAADKIKTPTMLITGDMDSYPMSQMQEMFNAIWRDGGDTTLLTYWGEGHGVDSPPNIKDLWFRTRTWFDVHLKGEAQVQANDR